MLTDSLVGGPCGGSGLVLKTFANVFGFLNQAFQAFPKLTFLVFHTICFFHRFFLFDSPSLNPGSFAMAADDHAPALPGHRHHRVSSHARAYCRTNAPRQEPAFDTSAVVRDRNGAASSASDISRR